LEALGVDAVGYVGECLDLVGRENALDDGITIFAIVIEVVFDHGSASDAAC
jgi:hypothetical protein